MRNKGRKIRALEAEVTDLRMQVAALAARLSYVETLSRPIAYDPFRPLDPGPFSPGKPYEIWCQEISDTIASEARTDA